MSILWLGISAALLLLMLLMLLMAASVSRRRARELHRLRDQWGATVERTRHMDAIFASHASRVASVEGCRALDDRTWTDLNLDDVFAVLDRTESTLGAHTLYRNAIALLKLSGAPDELLRRAESTAEMLDRERGTTLVSR